MSLGLWCNGNTADSGPAFPGSSPGSPTERFPNGNLFFLYNSILVAIHSDAGSPAKFGGINLKSHPAVEFTINLFSYILFVVFKSCSFLKKRTKNSGTRAHQSLTPPARELPCRQYNSSVPRLPLQAFLSSVGCCGSHCVRQFWKNIIAVLRLDGPRTMACCRQGSPLCCLRCRFLLDYLCSRKLYAHYGNIKERLEINSSEQLRLRITVEYNGERKRNPQ